MQIVPTTLVERLIALVPKPYRHALAEGLRALNIPAVKLGLEVLEIEREGVSYAHDVRQESRRPQFSRFHHGTRDLRKRLVPVLGKHPDASPRGRWPTDLRRLRLCGIIERTRGTHRWARENELLNLGLLGLGVRS